jgi:hypothetical protein
MKLEERNIQQSDLFVCIAIVLGMLASYVTWASEYPVVEDSSCQHSVGFRG